MECVAVKERRIHRRYVYPRNLRFRSEASLRKLPARCVNISSGGMLLNIFHHSGLRVGQDVVLSLPTHESPPSFPGLCLPRAGELVATIVRIEREGVKTNGYMRIGVEFAHRLNGHQTAYFE